MTNDLNFTFWFLSFSQPFFVSREFVSCVQSIQILPFAEEQQMSLDGDLANVAVPNNQQACSGSDSGNAWKGQYDDNSAASFNR